MNKYINKNKVKSPFTLDYAMFYTSKKVACDQQIL